MSHLLRFWAYKQREDRASTLRAQECPIFIAYLFATGGVAKPRNRPTLTAPLRLALDENLRILKQGILEREEYKVITTNIDQWYLLAIFRFLII